MPTYEYICTKCQHEWEHDQRIKDAPLEFCVKCGEKSAKRLISRTAFVLAGGGWAATNYSKTGDP